MLTNNKYISTKDLWLNDIPSHWEIRRLKYIADLRFSNVDKNTIEEEQPVHLCNYMDVYRNDYITSDLDFMSASASEEEILKFKLKKGDVLITKDSETANDIAVPALVPEDIDYVICGYHIAQIRPNKNILNSEYLFNLFKAKPINVHFEINATGVTRHGLSIDSLASVLLPLPPKAEQAAIVSYIKVYSDRIGKFIEKKQLFLELLKEKRNILINQTIITGIDRKGKKKQSGIDWLDKIPEHWEITRCKNVFREIDVRSENGGEELLSVSHYDGVKKRSEKDVTMFLAEDYTGSKLCWPGDLVINIMWAWMGALGISKEHGIVSSAYGVYRLKEPEKYNPEYLDLLLRHPGYITEYTKRSKGVHSSRARMYSDEFFTVMILTPPVEEQDEIVEYIKSETRTIDIAIAKAEREIELIKEYKEAMIAEAVMGIIF
ncbi:MAG TPA: restriction endonuclease subunit S [Ignavibacteriales bacterium]|nr:restriction endonuclease subunit S [Ignavibacteriales bacterium]